jgi:hypothetical protein
LVPCLASCWACKTGRLWPRGDGDFSEFMRWLSVTHTQRWHAAHHTSGRRTGSVAAIGGAGSAAGRSVLAAANRQAIAVGIDCLRADARGRPSRRRFKTPDAFWPPFCPSLSFSLVWIGGDAETEVEDRQFGATCASV